MSRVQMDYRLVLLPLLVHGEVQKAFLGGRISRHQLARPVEFRETRRIETAQAGARRREEPTVLAAGADVAGAAVRQAAIENRSCDLADLLPQFAFAHLL